MPWPWSDLAPMSLSDIGSTTPDPGSSEIFGRLFEGDAQRPPPGLQALRVSRARHERLDKPAKIAAFCRKRAWKSDFAQEVARATSELYAAIMLMGMESPDNRRKSDDSYRAQERR
jgi:hypothetical protein